MEVVIVSGNVGDNPVGLGSTRSDLNKALWQGEENSSLPGNMPPGVGDLSSGLLHHVADTRAVTSSPE